VKLPQPPDGASSLKEGAFDVAVLKSSLLEGGGTAQP